MILSVIFVAMLSTEATGITLTGAVSRKVHAGAGTFDLTLNIAPGASGVVSVEPRALGTGHLIVFTFDEPVTNSGVVTALDAGNAPIGNIAMPIVMGKEVHVVVANVPDRRRVKVTLTGVSGASGVTNASVSIGFLIGNFNDSGSVSVQDSAAAKSRSGQLVDFNSFRFDVNTSGRVSASDIATTKSRMGLTVVTSALPLKWNQGGWDLDLWQ